MQLKQVDDHNSFESDALSSSAKSDGHSFRLPSSITEITQIIEETNFKIQSIRERALEMSSKQIKEELDLLPDLKNLALQIGEFFHLQDEKGQTEKFFYQIPTEFQLLDQNVTDSIYEIPVEMVPFQSQNLVYEVPVEMAVDLDEHTIASYFQNFQRFENLPPKIQLLLQQYILHRPVYQVPVQICLRVDTTEAEAQTIEQPFGNIEDYEIPVNATEADWNEVTDALDKMNGLIKKISPTENYTKKQNTMDQEIYLTGDLLQDLKIMDIHKFNKNQDDRVQFIEMEESSFQEVILEKQFHQVSVQCEESLQEVQSQSDEEFQYLEVPVHMKSYTPQLKINSKVLDFKIASSKDNTLIVSAVSVYCDEHLNVYNIRDSDPLTPTFKEKPTWSPPNIDFEISKSNNQEFDSFRNSKHQSHIKESLNFKESAIPKKEDKPEINSEIMETLAIRQSERVCVIISESSSEASHTDREMYISGQEHQNIGVFKIKQKEEAQEKEMEEVVELKEKLYTLEEENSQLLEKLMISQQEVKILKDEVIENRQTIEFLNQSRDRSQFSMIKEEYSKIEQFERKQEKQIEELDEENSQLKSETENLAMTIRLREDEVVKMKEEVKKIEEEFFNKIEKMENEIVEKENTIDQMEKEVEENSNFHKSQILSFIKVNEELRTSVEGLQRELDEKGVVISELKENHDKMMNEIEEAWKERNEAGEVKEIYEKEYEKMKQDFDDILENQDKKLRSIAYEKERIFQQLKEKDQMLINSQNAIEQHQKVIEDLREELQYREGQLNYTRTTIPPHVQAELDYLRKEIISITKEVDLRDKKIKELNFELKEKARKERSSQLTVDSTEGKSYEDQEIYIEELEKVIFDYENIILSHIEVIKDLQGHVYEYLEDAIEKEEDADVYYENLIMVENGLNQTLRQKIVLEKENRRLKKMIQASQKKISSIGNKLMYVAKEKLKEDSVTELRNLRSQNSTVKMTGKELD